jgi:hypothetical protein
MDVTDETFYRDVVERSHERPIVVDFWGRVVRPMQGTRARAGARGRRAPTVGARQGRRRREPRARRALRDPEHPGGKGIPERTGRRRADGRTAAADRRLVPGRAAGPVGGGAAPRGATRPRGLRRRGRGPRARRPRAHSRCCSSGRRPQTRPPATRSAASWSPSSRLSARITRSARRIGAASLQRCTDFRQPLRGRASG